MARKAIVQFNKLGDATPEEVKQQRLQSFGLKIKHYRNPCLVFRASLYRHPFENLSRPYCVHKEIAIFGD